MSFSAQYVQNLQAYYENQLSCLQQQHQRELDIQANIIFGQICHQFYLNGQLNLHPVVEQKVVEKVYEIKQISVVSVSTENFDIANCEVTESVVVLDDAEVVTDNFEAEINNLRPVYDDLSSDDEWD